MSAHDSKETKRMLAQYNKAIREPDEYIKYAISDENPYDWYIMIYNIAGDKDEYIGGEFIFHMQMPKDFPYKPPSFFAKTPNGVYDYEKRCCISIGEYHADDYRASLGVAGFARELANGMMNWPRIGAGINLIRTSAVEKKKLSLQSKKYNNTRNEQLQDMINHQFKKYSEKWDKSKIPFEMQKRLGIASDADGKKEEQSEDKQSKDKQSEDK